MKKRIASIDFGLARMGLALSDERKIIASPLKVIPTKKNPKETIASILETLAPYQIETIIVGLPLRLNGKKSPMTLEVERFLKLLQEMAPYPVVSLDERFTTLQAERTLREANLSRKKRAPVIDAVAATLLLQNFLDLNALT